MFINTYIRTNILPIVIYILLEFNSIYIIYFYPWIRERLNYSRTLSLLPTVILHYVHNV